VANQVSDDVELAAVEGDARKLSEWLTTFQLVTVVLDPYTAESAWILETAGRFLVNFRDADCRVSLTVTADATDARKFLGPWADELLTFADPDRVLVKALDLKRLPALVHIRQDLTVVGASEGWDPPAWEEIGRNLAKVMSWSHPELPQRGDPGPFEGTVATG
jgi:hypothetical protein